MRLTQVTALLFAVALMVPAALAQGDVSVALVNIDEVLSESRSVRAQLEAVNAEVAERQRHLDRRDAELLELIETFRSQSALLSEEAREAMQRDIVERRLEINEIESDLRALLRESEDDVIAPMFDEITEVIRLIAEENGIDIVLRSDAAVYAAPDLDITEEVIDLLNRRDDASRETNLPEEK
ncbi:OmpH family outer membrane protein [Candidatus Sumerlaeota bacterium]|nr:OmpH family outer membrane protein [Candidatus Sumerlaeota bacterium]